MKNKKYSIKLRIRKKKKEKTDPGTKKKMDER